MEKLLGRFSDIAYAILRVVTGFLFACHGAQKLFGVLGGAGGTPGATVSFEAAPQMFVGGVLELVGGTMIAVGWMSGLAAFICSGMMAVAYFQFHFGPGPKIWPIVNKGELAAIYCFVFLYISTMGAGMFGLSKPDRPYRQI